MPHRPAHLFSVNNHPEIYVLPVESFAAWVNPNGGRHVSRLSQAVTNGKAARPLWAYLARVAGDPALADDILQECYCRLLASAKPPQEAAHQKNYLFRIATNLLRDHWRQAQRRSTAGVAAADAAADDPAVENVPLRSDLSRALAQLKPNERQLLWLAYAEGASHKEIAERSGLKSASIRPLLYGARKKLVALMGR